MINENINHTVITISPFSERRNLIFIADLDILVFTYGHITIDGNDQNMTLIPSLFKKEYNFAAVLKSYVKIRLL